MLNVPMTLDFGPVNTAPRSVIVFPVAAWKDCLGEDWLNLGNGWNGEKPGKAYKFIRCITGALSHIPKMFEKSWTEPLLWGCDLLLRAPGDSVNVGRAFALAEGLPTDACIYLYWSVLARHKFQLIIKSRSLNQIEGTGRQLSWQITKDVVLLDFFEVLFWNLPPKMDEWAFSLFSRARVLRLSPIDTKRVDSNMPRIVPAAWVEGSKKTRLYSFGGTQDVPELFFFFLSLLNAHVIQSPKIRFDVSIHWVSAAEPFLGPFSRVVQSRRSVKRDEKRRCRCCWCWSDMRPTSSWCNTCLQRLG